MINVMADVIGLDETYMSDRLNDPAVWERFINDLFKRMNKIDTQPERGQLDSIDSEEFQCWIDDPAFWAAVNEEIARRLNVVRTLLPSPNQGHC